MTETILITGGAGFIGSHLATELLKHGYRVRALDNLSPQVHGPGCRQPGGAAAPRQTHEHRFSNVILLVPEPEHAGPKRAKFQLKEMESRRPCLGFARPRAGGSPPARPEPHLERRTEAPAKDFVAPRRTAAQAVVEVQCHQFFAASGPVRPQQQQERERIGTAGKSHRPRAPGRRLLGPPRQDRRMQPVARKRRGQFCRAFGPVDFRISHRR